MRRYQLVMVVGHCSILGRAVFNFIGACNNLRVCVVGEQMKTLYLLTYIENKSGLFRSRLFDQDTFEIFQSEPSFSRFVTEEVCQFYARCKYDNISIIKPLAQHV